MNKSKKAIILLLLPYRMVVDMVNDTDVINSNKPGESFSAFTEGISMI